VKKSENLPLARSLRSLEHTERAEKKAFLVFFAASREIICFLKMAAKVRFTHGFRYGYFQEFEPKPWGFAPKRRFTLFVRPVFVIVGALLAAPC